MIARNVNARNVQAAVLAIALVCVGGGATGCKKKPKPFPPAPQLISNANANPMSVDAGTAVPMLTMTPSSLPTPADTLSPPDRAAFDTTKASVAVVDAMVKKGVTSFPDQPEEDATSKCVAIEDLRPRLEALSDPEAKQLVTDSKTLCSLEVPILNADHALKQVTISPSQASHQLMCKYAQKDIEKSRAFKPNDRRVRDLDARFTRSCR